MLSSKEADDLLLESYVKKGQRLRGYDWQIRKLDGIRKLLEQANIPLDSIPAITITGSKGKGSTAIFASALLMGQGYCVGLLTSPSYFSLRERIRINGQAIDDTDYRQIVTDLAPLIQTIDAALPDDQYLSPTGLFLAVALRHFHARKVDALVLEVGRGGRFDDVSLVRNQVSALTPIHDEHLANLGPTIRDVAWNKTGIIKHGSQVVSAKQTPEVRAIIESEAQAQAANLRWVLPERDFRAAVDGFTQNVKLHDQRFTLNQIGQYLPANLALASAAVDKLLQVLPPRQAATTELQKVLYATRLPGRVHLLQREPVVWLDGATNGNAARIFCESVLEHSPQPRTLVTALPVDRDRAGFWDALAPHVDKVIVTQIGYHTFDQQIVDMAQASGKNVYDILDATQALARGLEVTPSSGSVWVLGVQSLVREALRFWQIDLENLYPL